MITDKKGAIQTAKKLNEKYKKSRLGKENIMNNGQKAVIIAYRNAMDIDILFDDRTIVERKQYSAFQNGNISNPNFKLHLGETKTMNNGMKATIIKYSNNQNIDIKFEDGTIVKHKKYDHFQNGLIANPNYIPHLGKTKIMKNGQKATVIAYRNRRNIDIQFEDGTIVEHKSYHDFQTGIISNPNYKPRIGESRIMNNGMEATIEIYRNAMDLDIRFKDGTIVKHKAYDSFLKGSIANPNYIPYLGETKIMNNGMKATIIVYRKYDDIDILFNDRTVVEHKQYFHFQNGNIAHPNLSGNPRRISIFHNFEVKFVARTKDTAFYKCKCLSCNIEEILTPQQMIEHEREEIEKELPEKELEI